VVSGAVSAGAGSVVTDSPGSASLDAVAGEVSAALSIAAVVPLVTLGSSVVQARRAADIARVTSNLPR